MDKFSVGKEKPIWLGVEIEADMPALGYTDYRGIDGMVNKVRKFLFTDNGPKFRPLIHHVGQDGGGIEVALNPMTLEYVAKNRSVLVEILQFLQSLNLRDNTGQPGMHVHICREAYTGMSFARMIHFVSMNKELTKSIAARVKDHGYRDQNSIQGVLKKDDIEKFAKATRPLLVGESANPNVIDKLMGTKSDDYDYDYEDDEDYDDGYQPEATSLEKTFRMIEVNRKMIPTLEFRLFQATLDPARFFANIEFVHALRYFSTVTTKKEDLLKQNFLTYVRANSKKYAYLERLLVRLRYLPKIESKKTTLVEA